MMHIKEPLLLIGKSSPCDGSGFLLYRYLNGPLPFVTRSRSNSTSEPLLLLLLFLLVVCLLIVIIVIVIIIIIIIIIRPMIII